MLSIHAIHASWHAVQFTNPGVKALQGALGGAQAWACLSAYLCSSPTCGELTAIWDAQLAAKDPKVLPQLLLLISGILSFRAPAPTDAAGHGSAAAARPGWREVAAGGGGGAAADASPSELLAAAQRSLIRHCLQRKLKQLYHAVGSETRILANAALHLLAAIAGHSAAAARDLAGCFDFSLAALAKVARPPRCGLGAGFLRWRLAAQWVNGNGPCIMGMHGGGRHAYSRVPALS